MRGKTRSESILLQEFCSNNYQRLPFPEFSLFSKSHGKQSLSGCILSRATIVGADCTLFGRPGWKHLPHGAAADPRCLFPIHFPTTRFSLRLFYLSKRDGAIMVCENRTTRNRTNSSRHLYNAYGATAKSKKKIVKRGKKSKKLKTVGKKEKLLNIFYTHTNMHTFFIPIK